MSNLLTSKAQKEQPGMTEADVARRIKEIRQARRLSQGDLAQRTNSHRESICRIETGKQHITIDRLFAIAAALNVQPTYLLTSSPVTVEVTIA